MRLLLILTLWAGSLFAAPQYNLLTPEQKHIIEDKGTEAPFTGKYNDFFEEGTYVCARCNAQLFHSTDKFKSHCGWPSFDDEIKGAIKRVPDRDGYRTEIVCANCGAHLGHVFEGEKMTAKDTRHCVNSLSLKFIPLNPLPKIAYFAGGCFWGMEHHFEKLKGVKEVVSGYMGGHTPNPTYREVSGKKSGHVETVKVVYDSAQVDYETLARLFFEIHDPTQKDGQGPDIGPQYKSVAFYSRPEERQTIDKLIGLLRAKGYDVATEIKEATAFYPAEAYHQDYYERKGSLPYCHVYQKRF